MFETTNQFRNFKGVSSFQFVINSNMLATVSHPQLRPFMNISLCYISRKTNLHAYVFSYLSWSKRDKRVFFCYGHPSHHGNPIIMGVTESPVMDWWQSPLTWSGTNGSMAHLRPWKWIRCSLLWLKLPRGIKASRILSYDMTVEITFNFWISPLIQNIIYVYIYVRSKHFFRQIIDLS